MSDLINPQSALTMTSREIAELVGSRHDDTKRSIERLANQGVIVQPPTADEPGKDAMGRLRVTQVYVFSGERGKRDSIIVVAQLSPEFTARLVDRWQQLEAEAAKPMHLIPQSLPEALRLAADLAEQKAQAVAALAVAAPKAEALDRMAGADGSLCITDAAKVLKVRPKDLFQWLHANHWIFRRPGSGVWVGYADKVQVGLLEMIYTTVKGSDDQDRTVERVKVTPRGMTKLAQVLDSAALKRAA